MQSASAKGTAVQCLYSHKLAVEQNGGEQLESINLCLANLNSTYKHMHSYTHTQGVVFMVCLSSSDIITSKAVYFPDLHLCLWLAPPTSHKC